MRLRTSSIRGEMQKAMAGLRGGGGGGGGGGRGRVRSGASCRGPWGSCAWEGGWTAVSERGDEMPAVHHDRGPGHPGGRIRGEQQECAVEVLGAPEAAGGDAADHLL